MSQPIQPTKPETEYHDGSSNLSGWGMLHMLKLMEWKGASLGARKTCPCCDSPEPLHISQCALAFTIRRLSDTVLSGQGIEKKEK